MLDLNKEKDKQNFLQNGLKFKLPEIGMPEQNIRSIQDPNNNIMQNNMQVGLSASSQNVPTQDGSLGSLSNTLSISKFLPNLDSNKKDKKNLGQNGIQSIDSGSPVGLGSLTDNQANSMF